MYREEINISYRKRKLILNTGFSILYQLVAVICGFILPRLFLQYYGSEVNGLISSITQFLGVVALMELGIGAVVQSVLYKPLALSNNEEVSRIIKSAQQFFNKIAMVFILYLLILIIVYPRLNDNFSWEYTASLIVILAISLIAQYFFGMTYQLLLTADQKAYIPKILSIITLVLNTFFSVVLIINGASIHIVKLVAAIVLLLRPISLNLYANHHYKINKNIKILEEPIKQKWNGIAQHVASFVLCNTDIIVLTLFSTLTSVSIYAVYNLVVIGIKQIIMALITGVQALFGNMLANKEYDALKKRFLQFEWMMHTIITLLFSCIAILIVPFVQVYTKGIIDANYYQPLFGWLLTFATAAYCLRLPYNIMVLSAGHYKQTQASAIIEMSINLVLSILLVSKFGLIGVAIGTLVAMTYRTIYLAYYLSNNIIEYKFLVFSKHIVVDLIIFCIVFIIITNINIDLTNVSYLSWFVLALKVFFITFSIVTIVNIIFYKTNVIDILNIFRKKIFRSKF